MYCPKCGKKNEGDIKFCIFCGYKFEKEQESLNLNYYEILEITQDASQEVIKAAYKALVKKFHPDNINRKRDENRTIEEINMAYEVLSNPEQRKIYDMNLSKKKIEVERRSESYYDKPDNKAGETSNNEYDDKIYGDLIAESVVTIIAFITFRYFEFGIFVLIITGLANAYTVGRLAGKVLGCVLKKMDSDLDSKIWIDDHDEAISGCCELAILQWVFVYLKINNWITKIFLMLLILVAASLLYSGIKLVFFKLQKNRKER